MLRNYLKMSIRTIKKQKAFSIINLAGLATGMACCILILLFVQDELSYDKYHKNADNIYRVATDGVLGGTLRKFALAPAPAGPEFVEQIPEVLSFTRLFDPQILNQGQTLVKHGDESFEETGVVLGDSTFFEIFTYEFLSGDPETALDAPNTVVITKEIADKIFGDDEAVGEVLTVTNLGNLTVTGVVENVPRTSHFRFNYVLSMMTLPAAIRPQLLGQWLSVSSYTYLLLDEAADISALEAKFAEIFEEKTGAQAKQFGITMDLYLQKLTDIHLGSQLEFELEANSEKLYVYIFSAIAVFILLIACINFMNLSTAKSTNRAREVGLRKVFGAYKNQLVSQFLSESFILALLGLVIAVLLVWIALPAFSNLSGKEFVFSYLIDWKIIAGLLGMMFFTGLFAGSYPAFFLSAFRPVQVLKGMFTKGSGSSALRRVLVVLQFSISVILITSTIIVLNQLNYMKNKQLGFDKEQIIVISVQNVTPGGGGTLSRWRTVKSELKQSPNVLEAAFSSSVPGRVHAAPAFVPEGNKQNETLIMDVIFTDYNFVETYGIDMAAGRGFSEEFATDSAQAFLINETAAKKIGWTADQAIGRDFSMLGGGGGRPGKIVGVMKDFHSKSVKIAIEPLVLTILPQAGTNLSVRVNTDNIPETLNFLREKWTEIEPGRQFNYFFLDSDFDKNYQSEEKLGKIFTFFAILAIVIACLGLFGLASFTTERRTKEIGIRKVLGASVDGIIIQLSKDFTKWVLIANVVAWPLTYYLMNNFWLSNFPFRIEIGINIFLIAGAISMLIALVTVSYQSIKAGLANPIKALRYE